MDSHIYLYIIIKYVYNIYLYNIYYIVIYTYILCYALYIADAHSS